MPLTLEQKKAVVAEVNEKAKVALSAIVADYRGLTVSQMTEIRKRARAANIYMRVVPNNLTRRAFEDTEFACLHDELVGPLFLALSMDAPGAAARLLREACKGNDKLTVKAIALSGKVIPATQLEAVAKLPTKDEAISLLMSVMKAPIEKLVRTMVEPTAKLVRTFAALKDQKQQAG